MLGDKLCNKLQPLCLPFILVKRYQAFDLILVEFGIANDVFKSRDIKMIKIEMAVVEIILNISVF